jgi:hypothetical protein
MSSVAVHTIALSRSIFIPVTCSCSHLAVKSSAIAEPVTSTSSVYGTTVNMREVSHDRLILSVNQAIVLTTTKK